MGVTTLVYKRKDFISRLKRKGFKFFNHSKHDVYQFYDEEDRPTRVKVTVINRHQGRLGEVGNKIMNNMADVLELENLRFRDLIECPMSHQDLCQHLRTLERL